MLPPEMIEFATITFCFLFVITLIWVTLKGKEAWPLSCYPMFSNFMTMNDVAIFRLAMETKEGEIIWWSPRFPRYQRRIGKVLKRIHLSGRGNNTSAGMTDQYTYLVDVARLIIQEQGSIDRYQAFCIFRRSIRIDSGNQWIVNDDLIERIPMASIEQVYDHD